MKPKRDLTGDPVTPLAVPDSFYQLDDAPNMLVRSTPFSVAPVAIVLTLAIPPLACLLGALAWRRLFPSAAQREARQRSQSAQRALAQLRSGAVPWIILCRYLHERFDFAVDGPTPARCGRLPQAARVRQETLPDAAAFLAKCDVIRYTDASMDGVH